MGSTPRIEECLARAHADFASLRSLRRRAVAAGMDAQYMPPDNTLRAFALLGDHDRLSVEHQLGPQLPLFIQKGITSSRARSGPELRFLYAIVPFLDSILDISQRIELRLADMSQDSMDTSLVTCASNVSASWGQALRIFLALSPEAEWLLIKPDPVFGLRDTLRPLNPVDGQIWFELSCDIGCVTVAVLSRSGKCCRRDIRFEVSE